MQAWVVVTELGGQEWLSFGDFGLREIEEACGMLGIWHRVYWQEIGAEGGGRAISFVNG